MPAAPIISFKYSRYLINYSFGLLLMMIFLCSFRSMAQEDQLQILKARTDSILGADDELINGKIYIQEHLMAGGHPFFLSPEWQQGNITVNGDLFEDVFLKYNIYTDELILKAERYRGGTAVISLNNGFVDDLHLEDRYFINSMDFKVRGLQTDFVELIYHGRFDFYVSYVKLFNNNYSNKTPYGNYAKTLRNYYIFQDSLLTSVSSKKSLLSYFDLYKKEVKKYLKKHKIKYGRASYEELHSLMQYCEELTTGDTK